MKSSKNCIKCNAKPNFDEIDPECQFFHNMEGVEIFICPDCLAKWENERQ